MLSYFVRLGLVVLSLAALFLSPQIAQAQTVYSDRGTFVSANPGLSSFNFDGIAPDFGYTDYSLGSGQGTLSLKGVSFSQSDPAGGLYVVSRKYDPNYALDNSDFLQATDDNTDQLDVNLPSNITAFGADFGTFEEPDQIGVVVNGVELPTAFLASDTNAGNFFGYTSLVPIQTLSFIEKTGSVLNINNVEFGQAAPTTLPVPEASSALSLTLLFGLGGAAWSVKKQKKSAKRSIPAKSAKN